MKYLMTYEENKLLDFIENQDGIFKKIKEYLVEYEPNITKLEIVEVIRIRYFKLNKTFTIWYKDHREQFDFTIKLDKNQSEILKNI